MIYRRKPDEFEVSVRRKVLDAMGRCRKKLIDAHDQVRPFGPAYLTVQPVLDAINKAAAVLTGNDQFYSAGGSAPGSDEGRWKDSGT